MKARNILFVIVMIYQPWMACSNFLNLSGLLLTGQDLLSFKNNSSIHSFLIEKIKKENNPLYKYIQSNCTWHLQDPMIGMAADTSSSYIPYRFNLWQLAPKRGVGVSIVILDTGIAAFEGTDIPKHPDLSLIGFNPLQNYNCCFQGLNDFIKYSSSFLKKSSTPQESEFIKEIVNYCTTKKTDGWHNFLKKYGNSEFFDVQGNLTKQGNQAITELTEGRKGIMPKGVRRSFSPILLKNPLNYATLRELLPIPSGSLFDKNNYCLASHGTHVYGIINSQGDVVCGLAPNAQTIMLKVSDGGGASDAYTILDALKKAQNLKGDIINISLKIEQTMHNDICHKIEQELQKFKYVVAASGNEFSSAQKPKVSFPACLTSLAFTMGAYYYDGKNYTLCPFSQYEKNCGPKFVAPGFNILSTSIPKQDGEYLFLSGTSMATALMSGFVALMLAEFKDIFTQEQLLKVCYCSSKKMDKTADWDEKCRYGVLDMRTVLFILQVCKQLKENNCFDEEKFEVYLKIIGNILRDISNCADHYKLPKTLEGTINFITTCINDVINGKSKFMII